MKDLSENIKNEVIKKGYKVFDLPFELNIVAFRKAGSKPGNFDDELHVFARVGDNAFVHHVFNFLTDPGTFWLGKKGKPQKSIMLAQGQYKDCFQLSKIKSSYQLRQAKPVTVFTRYDRKAKLDLFKNKKEKGLHRIEFHPARSNGKYLYVPTDHEGSQFFQRKEDYETFIGMCEGHEKLHGNNFTYTLIDQRADARKKLTTIGAIVGAVIAIIGTIMGNEK